MAAIGLTRRLSLREIVAQLAHDEFMVINATLFGALRELDWSHGRLVTELNSVMGSGYVGRSTVSEWVNQSRVPRDPLPTVIAHVLTEALGRQLSLAQLWQGRATVSQLWVASLAGIEPGWGTEHNQRVIADWLSRGDEVFDCDRRRFLSTWGAPLTGLGWSYVENLPDDSDRITAVRPCRRGRAITTSMVSICADTVDRLRKLDDHEGGNLANIRFAHRYLLAIGQHVHSGDAANSQVADQLVELWMQLCQIAGWMAYDAQLHGLAQRYYYSALHASRALGDTAFGAHALAHLTHQAIYCGKRREATELAYAAVEAAKDTSPAQQALVDMLLAHAEALSGNAYGFSTAADRAANLMRRSDAYATAPSWLYWFDDAECMVKRGHAMLSLARASSGLPAAWLTQAAELLEPRTSPSDPAFPREAVYNRLWLARSYLWQSDLERALVTATDTFGSSVVRSPRCLAQLRELDAELEAQPRLRDMAVVRRFRSEVREVVSVQSRA